MEHRTRGHRSEPRLIVRYEPPVARAPDAPVARDPGPTGENTHFQHDTGHSGANTTAAVAPPLTLRWHRHNTLQPEAGSSSPQTAVIVDGAVYSLELQYQASVLSARRLLDGHPLWERVFPLRDHGRGSISYDDGRLFVVHQDVVRAVDPATGRDVWTQNGMGDRGFAAATNGILAVDNRLLDAATGAETRSVTPGGWWAQHPMGGTVVGDAWYVLTHEHLARYSLATGTQQWLKAAAGFGAQGDPVVANEQYVVESVFSNDINTLYVSRADDGGHVRTIPGTMPPVLDGATVIVANDRAVSAVDLTTGKTVWTAGALSEPVAMPPALSGTSIYVATTASTNGPSHLYALDRSTGAIRWSTSGPDKSGYSYYFGYGSWWPSIAVAENHVVIPTHDGLATYSAEP